MALVRARVPAKEALAETKELVSQTLAARERKAEQARWTPALTRNLTLAWMLAIATATPRLARAAVTVS
jgi:hypothetical protein